MTSWRDLIVPAVVGAAAGLAAIVAYDAWDWWRQGR